MRVSRGRICLWLGAAASHTADHAKELRVDIVAMTGHVLTYGNEKQATNEQYTVYWQATLRHSVVDY